MNITKDTDTKPGTDIERSATLGEKIAGWGIALMIIWLLWNQ